MASRAMQTRLGWFRVLNWLTVILPAVILSAAGAELITGAKNPDLKWWIGGATLVGSMLVIVHKALKCDEHQAELTRLRKEFHSLAARYRTVHDVPREPEATMLGLENSLAELRRSADVVLPDLKDKSGEIKADRTNAVS